jgi:hypothetical protein
VLRVGLGIKSLDSMWVIVSGVGVGVSLLLGVGVSVPVNAGLDVRVHPAVWASMFMACVV